jgi:hypothetical protein
MKVYMQRGNPMKENWNGLVKLLEVWKTDAQGNVVWRQENLYNTFHLGGEEFVMLAVFAGGVDNAYIPESYYFGLDNRGTIDVEDVLSSLSGEPSGNGYSRIAVSSDGVFSVGLANSHYRATGPVISFTASGGTIGPVSNLFLATSADDSGVLVATVPLTQTLTLSDGEGVNMRMGLSLKDC